MEVGLNFIQGRAESADAPVHTPLVQATLKTIYDLGDVHAAVQKASVQGGKNNDSNHNLLSLYDRMFNAGPERFCVKPAGMPDFLGLYETLPNFAEALDEIQRAIALCVDSPDPLEVMPMLLLGPPGVGKTHFAQSVAHLMGTGFHMLPMASTTAGFIIGGSSSQWKNAKPGKVFDAFMSDQYANPVFLVDEIDKAGGDNQYDPLGALYTLLEHDTAAMFTDEFAEVPIDTTGAVWIATCNDERAIPSPIMNRMNVFEIKAPDAAQAARIALILYQGIRASHAWGKSFPEHPGEELLGVFSEITPRQMRRDMMTSFGNAKLARSECIKLDHIPHKKGAKKGPIGFLA